MNSRITFIIPNRGQKQEVLDYVISRHKKYWPDEKYIIVTQDDEAPFMRGQMFNVAFNYVDTDYVCLIDNDMFFPEYIDLIKIYEENDGTVLQPFEYIAQVNINNETGEYKETSMERMNYRCQDAAGGITFMSSENFRKCNGFSNLYIGWGQEDNEFEKRNKYFNINNTVAHITHPRRKNLNKEDSDVNHSFYTLRGIDVIYDGYKQTLYNLKDIKTDDNVTYLSVDDIAVYDTYKYLSLYKKHKYQNIKNEDIINILIVHYNTPELTNALIKSINKSTKNTRIYIFENSDKYPLVNSYSNVTILDNTNQQLAKYLPGSVASSKHTLCVDKFMKMYNLDDFILLDSDVIVKRDLREIVDNTCIFVSSVINETRSWVKTADRITPWCCYINNKLCREHNISFFYKDYMLDISHNIDGQYDSGAGFYKYAKQYKHKNIDINKYVTHYSAGSLLERSIKMGYKHNMTISEFLETNKQFYQDEIKDDVKISIIEPCYNINKSDLDRNIDIIKNQTIGFDNIEVILVDDCSTDGKTFDILKSYSDRYNNVKVYQTEKNCGPGGARNVGIEKATGEFISFLDHDDYYYSEDALEKMFKEAVIGVDVITGAYKHGEAIGNLSKSNGVIRNIKNGQALFKQAPALASKLIKRELLINNNIRFLNYKIGEDALFLTEVLLKAEGIVATENIVYVYNQRENESLTKTNTFQKTKDSLITRIMSNELLKKSGIEEKYYISHNIYVLNTMFETELTFQEYETIFGYLNHLFLTIDFGKNFKAYTEMIKNNEIEESYKIYNMIYKQQLNK